MRSREAKRKLVYLKLVLAQNSRHISIQRKKFIMCEKAKQNVFLETHSSLRKKGTVVGTAANENHSFKLLDLEKLLDIVVGWALEGDEEMLKCDLELVAN